MSPAQKELYAKKLEQGDPQRQQRLNAAADYMTQQQGKINKERSDWLRRQIEEKEYTSRQAKQNERDFDAA